MEQPPSSSDGLQPQDLSSTCTLPNIFDLSRNGEECLLKANPLDALHVVQAPGWFVNPGTSNGLLLPENDSDPLPLPTDQIQPDNAFSNTTVTLSYVSRSHVFSNHNPLSEHSPIYGVPPLSKAFVLHPSTYDASKQATDTGDEALEMDQHCLQQVSVPVGLTACDQFGFMSPAQVVENVAALCYLQQPPDLSGLQDVENISLEALKSLQQTNPAECRLPINVDELQNGAANGLWNVGPFEEGFSETHATNVEGLHRNGNPEVVFLISRSEEPIILQNNQGPSSFAISLNQDFISPLDPVSPPADEIDNVFSLPQAASSLCGENLFGGETVKAKINHVEETETAPNADSVSDFITSINQKPSGNTDKACNTESVQVNSISAENREMDTSETTDSLRTTKKTFERKKLPPRISRGLRLEAIVQNIHPTRYKSNRVTKAQASKISNLGNVSSKKNNHHLLERVCTAKKSDEMTTGCLQMDVKASNRCKTPVSTSCSKNRPALDCKATKTLDGLFASKKRSKKLRQKVSKKSSAGIGHLDSLPILKSSKKSRPARVTSHKGSAAAKKSHVSKRKKKKHKVDHASFFSPQEPEIKLKCLNYKGERKDVRDETFTPYVHVDPKDNLTCTVVNFPEENFRLKQGKHQITAGSMSGVVPTSPCLQYGRVSMNGMRRDALVCCICGSSANAMDLGDLHGPYYPEGFKSASKTLTNPQEDEEDHSDSDSSFCPKTGKWVTSDRSSWTCKSSLMACQRWSSDSELSSSPAAKRFRMDAVTDWYSPPVLPLHSSEYWLHADCGIWSAGVFLVKGKLYGLENAVKLAKESICSTCQNKGATLGCVFKGCPNKYHYRCAMQSGCALNEDNFSMKCRKHKNKSIKGSSHRQLTR